MPAALAYFLGLRKTKEKALLAKHENITVLGSRERPIPYSLFGEVFRPALYTAPQISRTTSGNISLGASGEEVSRPEESLTATADIRENMYCKWYPVFCTSLQGDTRHLLAIEIGSVDPWSLQDDEFKQSYSVFQDNLGVRDIVLPTTSLEDFRGKMKKLVSMEGIGIEDPFDNISTADDELLTLQAGTDPQAKEALFYEKLYELLCKQAKFDVTPEGKRIPLTWHLAKSRGMVLAKQLTPSVLDTSILRWEQRDGMAELKVDLACRNADNKEEIFFREETWGGQGTQEFALGDWIVADIVPLESKSVGDATRVTIKPERKYNVPITRTMPNAKFRQTYRTFENQTEKPKESNLSRFSSNHYELQNTMKLYNVALVGRVPGTKRTKVSYP